MSAVKTWILAATAGLCACGAPTQDAKVVTIGGVFDRTGPLALPATEPIIQLAVTRMNQGLTAAHYKSMQFKYVIEDDAQNNPAVAPDRAKDLVMNQGAKALLTDASAVSTALNRMMYDSDTSNDLNVPIMGVTNNAGNINNPNATDPDPVTTEALHNTLHWNFRTTMSGTIQTRVTARVGLELAAAQHGSANNQYKVETYGVDDSFGHGGASGTIAAMNARQDSLAQSRPYYESIYQPVGVDPSTYNYAEDITRLTDDLNESETPAVQDGTPDLIVETLSPLYALAFTKEYATLGNTIPLLHTAGFQGKSAIDQLGDLAEGTNCVATTALDGTSGEEFNQLFQASPGGYPVQSRESMLFDGVMAELIATVYAVEVNGLDDPSQVTGAQIRDALFKINDPAGTVITAGTDPAKIISLITSGAAINYEGASGPVDFDQYGNVLQRESYYQVKNGQWVEVHRYDCVADPSTCPQQ